MKSIWMTILVLLTAIGGAAQWVRHDVNTTASFRGLAVVNEKVVWASGTGGTVIRTTDGGRSWKVMSVPGAEKLDFRDIEAFDANTAYILSIGNGDASRIYKTADGGATWNLQFANKNEKAFFDALACWDKRNCVAMSDPVDGHYVLINTVDGASWNPLIGNQMPAAKDGEAAFAASGTCLYVAPGGTLFLVSGGNDARVFRSEDRGKSWSAASTPIVKGTPGSGIFSIAMHDARTGVIVGGNYEKPEERNDTFATTSDGGGHWNPGARPNGYRSGVAYVDRNIIVAVGTNGSDISYARSLTWEKLGDENLNAVAAKGRNAVWAVGPKGAVLRLDPKSIRFVKPPSRSDLESHYLPVDALRLSHDEISSTCPQTSSACSADRRISVSTVARVMEIPHEFVYRVTAGRIVGDGSSVEWDLTGVTAGTYKITAGISIPIFGGSRWDVIGTTRTQSVTIR